MVTENIKDMCGWQSFSTYRNRLFGIAILFILLFHSTTYWDYGALNAFIQQMNMGVEIFLFLSGMGLYFSFMKTNQHTPSSIIKFYKRRFFTVMVVYAIISLPFCVWQNIVERRSFWYFLFDWSSFSYWFKTENSPGWYVSLIIVLYAIYPFIHWLLFGKGEVHYRHIIITSVLEFILLICIFFMSRRTDTLWPCIERAFTRIPVFILGCCCGKLIYDKNKYTVMTLFFVSCCFVSMFILNRINWRLRYVLAIIPIMMVMMLICHLIIYVCKWRFVDKILLFFGSITLELYLVHNYLSEILQYYDLRKPIYYIMVVSFSIPISYMLSKIRILASRYQ